MGSTAPRRAAPRRPRSKAARRRQALEVGRRLGERYPHPQTALRFRSPWELLVSTILSAQSTDETVNRVTPGLFTRYPSVADFAGAGLTELEDAVHPTGFFRNKAKALRGAAAAIVDRYGGEVPDSMAELVTLPGVGRKTANVVLGSAFGKNEGVVVDTHVARLSHRLGLTGEVDPERIELDLMAELPAAAWTDFSHRLIFFGREVCTARRPRCGQCELADLCPSAFRFDGGASPRTRAPVARPSRPMATRRSGGMPA